MTNRFWYFYKDPTPRHYFRGEDKKNYDIHMKHRFPAMTYYEVNKEVELVGWHT